MTSLGPRRDDEPLACRMRGTVRSRAYAALRFRKGNGRTFLAYQSTPHPFHLTRPFYLEGDPSGMATTYLQSSSGGLYGDDDLHLSICTEDDAAAHVTTQASTIVHAARGGVATQTVTLEVAAGSLLEYLPDPVILFSGARALAQIRATVAPGGVLILSDSFLSHDPEGKNAGFELFESTVEIRRSAATHPIMVDRMRVAAEAWPITAPSTGRHFGCYGALYLIGDVDGETAVNLIERALTAGCVDPTDHYAGVGMLSGRGIACARFLCREGAVLNRLLAGAASGARQAVTGSAPARRPK